MLDKEQEAKALSLRLQGLSYLKIAKELGTTTGAVDWYFRRPDKGNIRRRLAPSAVPYTPPPRERLGCQYPVSEDRPWQFCGADRREGSMYCAAHHARCYGKYQSIVVDPSG
jgi:hypothetical protein